MGNTTSSNHSSSSQDSTGKEIHIRTDRVDGFYFTGELLTGSVQIPLSYFQTYFNSKNAKKPGEVLRRRSLNNLILIELVGDATYSAEVDAAADSDGHATHQVNLCRQRCLVTIETGDQRLSNPNQLETSFDQNPTTHIDSSSQMPTTINGRFQLQIPEDLPPSLNNTRPPSVVYTLELNLSSSRYRFQIPIQLSGKGILPHPTVDFDLNGNVINEHEIGLQATIFRRFFRPSEEIPLRITYSNPQQRSIRSIQVTLHQFYRVHHDQFRSQLDGKEWIFDASTIQREWVGETRLQLPNRPLAASHKTSSVGTTQSIECELDYRIFVQLTEKKGDEIHLTLPSIEVTYENRRKSSSD